MQPEQPKQQAQPQPRSSPAPAPQPSPVARPAAVAGGSSRLAKIAAGVVIVAALAFGGAIATGLLHVPGFDSGASAPQTTSSTQINPQQIDEGDHTLGVRIATLTPDLAKARQLNTSRAAGVVLIDVFGNSPAQHAGVRTNDVIVAVDGVPVRQYSDVASKVRLTPIGQQMGVTVERDGATQDLSGSIDKVTESGAKGGVREIARAIEDQIADGLVDAKTAGAKQVRLAAKGDAVEVIPVYDDEQAPGGTTAERGMRDTTI